MPCEAYCGMESYATFGSHGQQDYFKKHNLISSLFDNPAADSHGEPIFVRTRKSDTYSLTQEIYTADMVSASSQLQAGGINVQDGRFVELAASLRFVFHVLLRRLLCCRPSTAAAAYPPAKPVPRPSRSPIRLVLSGELHTDVPAERSRRCFSDL